MQSAIENRPNRNPPRVPNRARAARQASWMRPICSRTVSSRGGVDSLRAKSIGSDSRRARKPECISAAHERARARAAEFSGQRPASACRLARDSQIARLSNITASEATSLIRSTGTRAEGESARIRVFDSGRLSGTRISSNEAPVAFNANQALRLQLDQFLVPIISV
jgi:hypothetical protein